MRKTLFVLAIITLLLMPVLAFAQDGQPIDFGEVVTGEITDDVTEVFYNFIGGAGDMITISMVSTITPDVNGRPFDTYLYLRDANGQDLTSDDDGGTGLNSFIGPFVLPADGQYTVVAARFGGESNLGNVGTFELVVRKVNIPSITMNETVTIELNDSNPVAFYNFNPAPNEVLSVTGSIIEGDNSTGVAISVRTPDGQFVNQTFIQPASQMSLEPVFTSASSLLLGINREPMGGPDQVVGSVRLTLIVRTIETRPLTFGETINGTLDDANPSIFYTFDGTGGDLLRLEGQQNGGAATFDVTLYGPSGFSLSGGSPAWSGGSSFIVDPVQLDATGQYMLMVRRLDVNTGPGGAVGQTIGFSVTVSATHTPILEAGVAVEGTVGGDVYEQVFRYSGQAGQVVRVTLSGGSNYTPSIDIQGSLNIQGGNIMNANSQYPGILTFQFTLPQTGEYIFRVHNGAYNEQGPAVGGFRLLVEIIE